MISNYEDLKSQIAAHLQRDDLTSQIPIFVDLFEKRANRTLRSYLQDTIANDTLLNGASSIDIPVKLQEIITVTAVVGGINEVLQRYSGEYFDDLTLYDTYPNYYNIANEKINFDCLADQNYPIKVRYIRGFDLASDSVNTLLTQNPDCYLYGSLAAASLYIKDDRISLWSGLAAEAVREINHQSSRNRRSKLITETQGKSKYNINRDY